MNQKGNIEDLKGVLGAILVVIFLYLITKYVLVYVPLLPLTVKERLGLLMITLS